MSTWETFLRVEQPSLVDEAPALDEAWMVQRGIETISPAVLRHLRDDVAPLLTDLSGMMLDYHFLVHAHPLVPTTPDDAAPYIHLRLEFGDEVATVRAAEKFVTELPPKWRFTRCWDKGDIAGVDSQLIDLESRWNILARQSEWLLDLVCAHKDADLGAMVKHVRQYLHFFANMAQMKVA